MRLRSAVRRAGGRPLVALRRRRQRPVLSVVMPVYGVRAYLPAVLDSILAQDLGDLGTLEVVAVDDSSVDGSYDVLRDYARRDHRVRVWRQPNAGQGPARNHGVEKVRGEFLTFVDGDDAIPPGAFATMLRTLRASGSDFVVGDTRRFTHGSFTPTSWSRVVHRRDRIGVTLEEFPEATFDIIACNRMFRTAFWRERGLPFKARIPFQDHVPMLAAYVRAERFDVLREVTYHWRNREDRTSTSQQKARLTTVRHRVDVKADAWALLLAEAGEHGQDAWLARTLEIDFPPFVPHGIAGDAEYRTALRDLYRTYLDLARERPKERVLDRVSARQKMRAFLVAEERWDDVADLDAWYDEVGVMPPAVARDGAVVAVLPAEVATSVAGLPAEALRLSALETNAEGGVLRAGRSGDALVLTGWFAVRGLSAAAPSVTAWLSSDTEHVDLAVRPVDLPEANLWGRQRFADYTHAGFVATVPLDALPTVACTLALTLSTTDGEVTRSGPVLHHLPRTSGARPLAVDGVATRWDAALGYVVDVTPGTRAPTPEPGPRVAGATVTGDVLTLHLTNGSVHEVLLGDGRPEQPHLAVDDSFLGELPLRLAAPFSLVVVGVRADGGVVIETEPLLEPSSWGVSGRRRAEDAYAALPDRPLAGVLLLPGPDQEALARVLGSATWAPPAGTPAYYEALASAAVVVSDQPLGSWFTLREGQRHLTTGGSYPWAAFGRERWERDGLTIARVERELARARRTHDLVLAPSEEVAGWYVAQLGLSPDQVLVTGSPRLDALAGLAGLVGAAPSGGGRVRVLSSVPLDLGPAYEVTVHSPGTDLTAFDVAVLGADALRFDWAVLGRPMVFLAPDLDATLERLGPLVPWAGSAPGPVVTDAVDAAALLADLDGLRASYAEEIATFNARFNPLADGGAADRVAGLLADL